MFVLQAMEMEAQRRRRSSFKAVRHITVDDLAVLQYVQPNPSAELGIDQTTSSQNQQKAVGDRPPDFDKLVKLVTRPVPGIGRTPSTTCKCVTDE